MTGLEYGICRTQSRIYEYIANKGYDIEEFSEKYMRSDWCHRAMDTIYSRFQLADELECLDFIFPEIGMIEKLKESKVFDPDVAAWIGFTYRLLYLRTNISSGNIVEKIPFEVMVKYYPGIHTVDEDVAADIICNDFKMKKCS